MAQINTDLQTLITARNNMKTALIAKGQNVNNDIRTYAQAISNIDGGGGSGDVKLFETQQQMQNDPNPQEGDLAIVYGEKEISITEDTVFSSCTFPSTVTLPQAHYDWTNVQIESTDTSIYIEGQIYLTQTEFMFSIYGDTMYYDIMYSSEDGIEYIRTDSNPSTIDFGVDLKFNVYDTFSNDISYFMNTKITNYEGLFEYREDINKDKINFLDISSVTYTNNNDKFTFRFNKSNITKTMENEPLKSIISGYHLRQLFYDNINNKVYGVDGDWDKSVMMDLQGNIIGLGVATSLETEFNIYEIDVENETIVLYENVNTQDNSLYYTYSSNGTPWYTELLVSDYVPKTFCVNSDCETSNNSIIACMLDKDYATTNKGGRMYFSEDTDGVILHPNETKYWVAPTQLSATNREVYVESFYGKNGVEQGLLQKTDNLTREELLTKTKILSDIYNVTLDPDITTLYAFFRDRNDLYMVNGLSISNVTNISEAFANCHKLNFVLLVDTGNVTNMSRAFYNCNFLVAVAFQDADHSRATRNVTDMSGMFQSCSRLQNAPYLDTTSVTNMSNMFNGCADLRGVPLYNTANVTNMSRMFSGCFTMVYVPELDLSSALDISYMFDQCNKFTSSPELDTSNVTNMKGMFANCYNLVDVYAYNTTNVINMSSMFSACKSIITIPLFDTTNVTDMSSMFYGCTNLTDVPVYETSNIIETGMSSMFSNNTSLNNTSLNNILQMCINAIKITSSNYKTLKYIGLSQSQANTCETLSNYQAFLNAGWTTGY